MSDLRELHLRGTTGTVRMAEWNGTEHMVVPVVALMEGVIHAINADVPEYIPLATLSQAPHMWNNRPAVLKHPVKDGKQISANSPTVLESQGLGSVFHTEVRGRKLVMEAFIDPVKAAALGAGDMVKRLRAGETIEVSVGTYVVTEAKAGEHNGKPFKAIWKQIYPDHLAFLPEGIGTCSVKMGCGTRAAESYLVTAEGFEEIDPEHAHLITDLGGEGSGNFSHEGRPGEQGGDGPGGGGGKKTGRSPSLTRTVKTVTQAIGRGQNMADDYLEHGPEDFASRFGLEPHEGNAVWNAAQKAGGRDFSPKSEAPGTTHYGVMSVPTGTSNKASGKFHEGQRVRFDGAAVDRSVVGSMPVTVVNPHSNADKVTHTAGTGKNTQQYEGAHRHLPTATVKTDRGTTFEAHHHTLKSLEGVGQRLLSFFQKFRGTEPESDELRDVATLIDDLKVDFPVVAAEQAEDYKEKWAVVEPKMLKGNGDHPFTHCMTNIIPAMEREGVGPDDPEAFCGWWKAEHAEAYFGEGIHAAGEKPYGCSGGSTMDKVIKAAAIKLITETKGTGFEAGDVKFLEEMPDKSLENIKTLVETKIAAEKTAADLKAAEEKAEEEKKTAELKAAEEKKNAPPTEDEWLKTAPASIRTLVDRHKKADEAKRTELVGLLKVAQTAYSETELKTMDVDVLERLAMVAKIDYSGRGVVPRRAEAEDDVFSNPPDPYVPGLKAMREQKVQ